MRAAAHHARRQILGRYLDREADSLVFGLHPGGKPLLEGPDQGLEFNLSHSRGVGLLAVTVGAHVGIDIEIERDINDPLRIARRVMTRAEVDLLAGLDATARQQAFLDLWTRLEARQKALGRGVFAEPVSGDSLHTFSFRPEAAQVACLAVSPRMTLPQIRFFNYRAR
jgi:4'-phosphopantetheinyl transferase